MPHYYFHVRSPDGTARDEEGSDLPDLGAAREMALATGRELVADAVKSGRDRTLESVSIADESGRELAAVSIDDLLPRPLRK